MNLRKILTLAVLLIFFMPVICTGQTPEKMKAEVKGKEIFEKLITAIGGPGKINKLKNVFSTMEITRIVSPTRQPKFNAEVVVEYPDKYRYLSLLKEGNFIMAINGNQGWMRIPPENTLTPMTDQDVKAAISNILRDPIYIYRNLDRYTIKLMEEKDFDGKRIIDLLFTGPAEFHLYIDAGTYLPSAFTYREAMIGMADQTATVREEIFSDYKEVDGMKMSFKIVIKSNGKKILEVSIKEYQLNIKLKKDFFKIKGGSPNEKK